MYPFFMINLKIYWFIRHNKLDKKITFAQNFTTTSL
jgi:hypothetical protein